MFEIWQCFNYRDGILSRLATVKINMIQSSILKSSSRSRDRLVGGRAYLLPGLCRSATEERII
jgi:hypothetical protein